MKQKNIDMLNGNILSNIIRFTVPVILTGVLQLLFNAADLIVVGRFCGSASVGAVGATSSLSHLIINLFIGIFIAWFLSSMLPEMLAHTDFRIDYDMWGIALPVLIYLGKNRKESLLLAALGLVMLGINYGGEQWLALLALIPLAFYDGTRGKANIKLLFYLYYPAHLVIIYLLSMIF